MDRVNTLASLALFVLVCSPAWCADAPKPGADDASKANLAMVQGKWERKPEGGEVRRATKEIQGNKETVTFYGNGDAILRRHRVEFRLDRKGDVNLFTYFGGEIVEGEGKGTAFPASPQSYIYRVDQGSFFEVFGFLPGQDAKPVLQEWTRVGK